MDNWLSRVLKDISNKHKISKDKTSLVLSNVVEIIFNLNIKATRGDEKYDGNK